METLASWGERRFIEHIRQRMTASDDLRCGIGDDCAVVRPTPGAQEDILLTSDAVIAGRHFLPDDAPTDIGHKAIGRALSDIAAMGGIPRWALIDLVAPPDTPIAWVDALYAGATDLANAHGLAIVGGDTSASAPLALHVFAVGSVPRGTAVLRSGARPGDAVFVTGALGGSRSGRHLRFAPRIAEGQWLRTWANAMIDVSDGLATDIHHIALRSNVGARLEAAAIPIAEEVRQLSLGPTPLQHALTDGEDFELLFTVPAEKVDAFPAAWRSAWPLPCTRIGQITGHAGRVVLQEADGREWILHSEGFEHFRK